MKSIKNKDLITNEYCYRLSEWIKQNTQEFFSEENQCHSWNDFDYWPTRKLDRNHLILNGEICIIDRKWNGKHAYVVCQMRKNGCKDLYHVIDVDDLKYGDWKNGYFLIPDLIKELS